MPSLGAINNKVQLVKRLKLSYRNLNIIIKAIYFLSGSLTSIPNFYSPNASSLQLIVAVDKSRS